MKLITKIIATVFGIGYFPKAPGTAASAFCLAFFWFIPGIPPFYLAMVIIGLFFVGVWSSTRAEKIWGHDPSYIVIDEVVGQLITIAGFEKHISIVIGAFILFRLFDIVKCFPINYAEKLPKGWGVMLDDVAAGILAHLILWGIILIF